ncbi:transcriptional regulation of mitochondrial recombination-domain-containing protein [Lophiotrema nucula]|uniref:Large ribosomal subunit protein mL67 n=1 Tax=Lophiotrema nucula TaxID=690887 RepID=A0A6A5ZU32_9PLEO|nr:transcriptional regulation of mitochondrial recombination-domain-containing protein [Lophiotrema nucula]
MPRTTRNAKQLRLIAEKLRAKKASVNHGDHIFVFRNVRTNQVLYSLYPGLDQRHLKQLPFFGKKSKPAEIRADLWHPFCTVTFPSVEQGHDAFRKLQDFRKLHQASWDLHNPGWKVLPKKKLIQNIRDQKANSVADLAKALEMQGEEGGSQERRLENADTKREAFLAKQWEEIRELARQAEGPEFQKLEAEIAKLTSQIHAAGGNKTETRRIFQLMGPPKRRRRKMFWAQEMLKKRAEAEEKDLETERIREDTEVYREQFEQEARERQDRFAQQHNTPLEWVESSDREEEERWFAIWKDILAQQRQTIAKSRLKPSPAEQKVGRAMLAARRGITPEYIGFYETDPASQQKPSETDKLNEELLPQSLKQTEPFKLKGVEIQWVDLHDAEFAESWPAEVEHDTMLINSRKIPLPGQSQTQLPWLSRDEYNDKLRELYDKWEADSKIEARKLASGEGGDILPEPETKKGIAKYLPKVSNPFKRASAP